MTVLCQSCGQPINGGQPAVRVHIGTLGFSAHPHAKIVNARSDDWFHATCDVAVRSSK